MRRRINNKLHISCEDVDLTTLSDIEFYVKQGRVFFQYTPEVISASEMLVEIPYDDAMCLLDTDVRLQFAFTDAEGNSGATEPVTLPVGDLLKEAGYDPI